MLKINFIQDTNNEELVNITFNAVCNERALMQGVKLESTLAGYKSTLEHAGDHTAEEIDTAKVKIPALEAKIADLMVEYEATLEDHDRWIKIVREQCQNEEKGCAASKNAPHNILRLVACGDDKSLFNDAILDNYNWEGMYNAFMKCHGVDSVDANGMHLGCKEEYINLRNEINAIMRDWFSLPVATEYTKPVKIKLSKTDLAMINEAFVTGINVGINHGKDGDKFTGLTMRTAIRKKSKKDGTITYEGRSFKGTVAKIAFQYICG